MRLTYAGFAAAAILLVLGCDSNTLSRDRVAELVSAKMEEDLLTRRLVSGVPAGFSAAIDETKKTRYVCGQNFSAEGPTTESVRAVCRADKFLARCNSAEVVQLGKAGLIDVELLEDWDTPVQGKYRQHACVAFLSPEVATWAVSGAGYAIGTREIVEVTGVTKPVAVPGAMISTAEFTYREVLNELGRALEHERKNLNGTAELVLYDDGWRLKDIRY